MASSQSTTAQSAPSPIPSSLNLSFSPDARREIGAAFNQMKEVVRKDSTTTTASGDSTQTLVPPVHISGQPASTTAGPTVATSSETDSATQEVRNPVKQAERQLSAEIMPPPPSVTARPATLDVTPVTQRPETSGEKEEGELETSMEHDDEFVFDITTTTEREFESGTEDTDKTSRAQTPVTITPTQSLVDQREVTTAGDTDVRVTLTPATTSISTTVRAPLMPRDVEPALETSINVSLHGVSESSAVIETDRRHRESRRSTEHEPETTRRLFPCAAARVWYTAKERDYDLVVRCLQMDKTDRETLMMLHQALADFALQRALATPGVKASDIKQEVISTAEHKRREDYEAELKRREAKTEAEARAIFRGVRHRLEAGEPPLPPGEVERRMAEIRSRNQPAFVTTTALPANLPAKPIQSVSSATLRTVATIPPRSRRKNTEIPGPDDVLVDLTVEGGGARDERIHTLAEDASRRGDYDYRVYGTEPSDVNIPPSTTSS